MLVVTKGQINNFCEFLSSSIFTNANVTLDRRLRLQIAAYLYRLVTNSLGATPVDFENMNIGGSIGKTRAQLLTGIYATPLQESQLHGRQRALTPFVKLLIHRVAVSAPNSTRVTFSGTNITRLRNVPDIPPEFVDRVSTHLDLLLAGHNPDDRIRIADHVFSNEVCADIVLHIRVLLAREFGLSTVSYPTYLEEDTVLEVVPQRAPRRRQRTRFPAQRNEQEASTSRVLTPTPPGPKRRRRT